MAALLAFDGRGLGLRPLRLAWFDAYQMLMPRTLGEPPVLIVEIDEKRPLTHALSGC